MLNKFFKLTLIVCSALISSTYAMTMQHNGMTMDDKGMIMNENTSNLPKDCPKLAGEFNLTIHAGHKYAKNLQGKMFAFDKSEYAIPGCTKINITLINDDHIRHQLMIHGLPGYLYSDGMFTIEIYGPGEKTGSIIVSSDPKTYMMHCEVPQHMEKGMKAQLIVAGGDGNLPSIPGLTDPIRFDSYDIAWNNQTSLVLFFAFLLGCSGFWLLKRLQRYLAEKSKI